METTAVIRSSFGICSRPSSQSVHRSVNLSSNKTYLLRLGSGFSAGLDKAKSAKGRIFPGQKCFVVRASSSDSPDEPEAPIAPLQLESPVGQFLSQIMISHPHLVPAAVEQQLELLQTNREAEKQEENPPGSGTDLVLYRRIAEVKANDRRKALEEILYALVVQKFMEANVSLVPSITPSSPNWPGQDENLERLHSPEAYEMIQNHLALILGNRLGDVTSLAQISKLRVGQVYAASIMYGYFLKRVDQRFQLEKTIKMLLPQGMHDEERKNNEWVETNTNVGSHPEDSSWTDGGVSPGGFGHGMKPSRLRNYVMSFDGETLQKYASIRSKEAVSMIEKHTEALFGKPDGMMMPFGSFDSSSSSDHDHIKITFGGLKRLVLEAVTFGSFLWDVESHVDSRYHFVMN